MHRLNKKTSELHLLNVNNFPHFNLPWASSPKPQTNLTDIVLINYTPDLTLPLLPSPFPLHVPVLINLNGHFDQLTTLLNSHTFFHIFNTSPHRIEFLTHLEQALDFIDHHTFLYASQNISKLPDEKDKRALNKVNSLDSKRFQYKKRLHKAADLIKQTISYRQGTSLEKSLTQVLSSYLPIKEISLSQKKLTASNDQQYIFQPKETDHDFFLKIESYQKILKQNQILIERFLTLISPLLIDQKQFSNYENIKKHWESTFDSLIHPIAITNDKYEIIRMNESFAHFCNSPFQKLLGKNIFKEFFQAEIFPEFVNLKKNSLKTKATFSKDSQYYHFEIQFQKLKITSDEQLFLFVLEDQTLQTNYERYLIETAKIVEMGTIGSSIAHEINNPLGGVISFLQLILMDSSLSPSLRSEIQELHQSALNCKDIVEKLLRYMRRSHPLQEQSSTFNIEKVIKSAVAITKIKMKYEKIYLNSQISMPNFKLQGQSNDFTQAFCHIIDNSREAILTKINNGELIHGKIDIFSTQTENEYQLHIKDNGIGIEKSHLNQVTSPLFTKKNSPQHKGLGLTLAYQIANTYQAKMDIFSQPKEGTTVIFSFKRPDSIG